MSHHSFERRCNLCQRPGPTSLVYRVAGYDVERCDRCGLVFVQQPGQPLPEPSRLYSQEYYEGGVRDGYTDYGACEWISRRQARAALRRLRRYCPAGRLLEIGCGYGFFLLEARAFYEAKGVEISPFAAEQARLRGLDVAVGDFSTLASTLGSFDIVCLFGCIEHLADPFTCLRRIHDLLRPGGTLVINTGDIGALSARIMGRKWRLLTPPHHLFFFSRATLLKMLGLTGFEVVEVSHRSKLVPWPFILYQISPALKSALGPLGRLPFAVRLNLFDVMSVISLRKVS